jgi:Domain of unknown function (DUF4214)
MKLERKLALAAAVGTLALFAGSATAGTGSPAPVNAVEGQTFSGAVAAYTSSVTPNERFVAQAYLDLLGRAADPAALASFDAFLGSGGTRAQVAQTILGGDEYRARVVGAAYQSYLRRAPTGVELPVGVAFLKGGASAEQLAALVLGSSEYLATQGGGTVHGFLNALYLDVLSRPIDPAAEAVFTQQLAGVATREQVALSVLTSLEAREDVVASLYQRFLHRAPSAAELQVAVGLLDEGVMATLVGSAEYLQQVPTSFATATIDWGDGTPGSHVAVPASTVNGSHTYADEGAFHLTVVVADLDGTVTIPGTATVADAPLAATAVSFTASRKTAFTQTVATFTDGNPGAKASEFRATIAWGDGQTSVGTVSALTGGGFAVSGSHAYEKKGSYAVAVHIADAGGATADVVAAAQATR